MLTENVFYIPQTVSTNVLCWKMLKERDIPEGFVVVADYQTAGKGQAGNSWESARGKNLLFSIVLYPHHIPIEEQFLISQAVSVGIKNVLDTVSDDITIKWPNDMYWKDSKLAGILIETSLFRGKISKAVIGVGLNVNQTEFFSDAPHPISLKQIAGKSFNRKKLLHRIVRAVGIRKNQKCLCPILVSQKWLPSLSGGDRNISGQNQPHLSGWRFGTRNRKRNHIQILF